MSILVLMIPFALIISLFFCTAFYWAASSGQFDDLDSPAHRMIEPERKEEDEPKS